MCSGREAGRFLTLKLSCGRSARQVVHKPARLSSVQPINRKASDDLARVGCSDTFGGLLNDPVVMRGAQIHQGDSTKISKNAR